MKPFEYQRATDPAQAAKAASTPNTMFLAGGTNLIDLMKNGVENPARLIDINRLSFAKIEATPNGGLRLGALARNADTANHPLVRTKYPLLSRAILSGASPQLRNMATNGGNLLQRTRCPYFMDTAFTECNKRQPGTGCAALNGINRIHAILGASDQCIAVHPSDMCVALAALDAVIHITGNKGERAIAMTDFHRLPGSTPERDTELQPGELITAIELPPSPYAAHSAYIKVRDRASYEFALVSAAVGLEMNGPEVRSVRIALGGVAHKPWRAKIGEQVLTGKTLTSDFIHSAAQEAVNGAKPLASNAFKVELAKRAIVRAIQVAGGVA